VYAVSSKTLSEGEQEGDDGAIAAAMLLAAMRVVADVPALEQPGLENVANIHACCDPRRDGCF
jgi:hypothetical protein